MNSNQITETTPTVINGSSVETLLMTDSIYAIVIIIIMLIAGIVGGIAAYYLNDADDKSKRRSMTLGIVAAMIVPVFLNMISSHLLLDAQKEVDKLFVFLGFCVLAAVFSRNFLENIYNKVLQQVGSMGKQISNMEQAANEPDLPDEDIDMKLVEAKGLNENELTILRIISEGRYTYRSLSGLKKDTGLDRKTIDNCLNTLISKTMINSRVNNKNQLRYYLSSEGRKVLGELSTEQNESIQN